MIETILVAVEDDRERMLPVIDQAATIASGLGATVALAHVFSEAEFDALLAELGADSSSPDALARQNETVREAAGMMRDHGVDIEIHGAVGDAGEELLAFIESHDVDHVFLGSRRRSPAGKAVLGSVAQRILLSSERPCTIVVG